jgi:arylformamidase
MERIHYHDISVPIRAGMPVYEGDPPVEIALFSSINKGDPANVSRVSMGAHSGSHVDAPFHFLNDGKTVDEIPLDVLIGPASVVEFTGTGRISRSDLATTHLEGNERILFKTSNSGLWRKDEFHKEYIYISEDAAEYLVEIGIKLVGIDYLSVEQYHAAGHATHLTLLRAGVVLVEGLNLSEVQPGRYELICLPLLIRGGDGSPCRAILVER